MSDIKLSTHLRQWRAERPSEWKMDEFIRAAEKLEYTRTPPVAELVAALEDLVFQVEATSGDEVEAICLDQSHAALKLAKGVG